MGDRQPQRARKVHLRDEEIRQLREAGLSLEAVAQRTGLSRTYVERAAIRIRVGEEAELALRRQTQGAYRRRKRERDHREQPRREAARARASAWAKEHPEEQAQRVKAWADAHREQRREIGRASYERNKDKHQERMRQWNDGHEKERREQRKAERERNRDHRADLQRIYRQDPEINARVLAANRERRQLLRRLEKSGLPPKSVHPATIAEQRRNESEATEFFSRGRSGQERRRLRDEYVPTPPELIEQWERRSKRARERRQELEALKRYVAKHGDRLRDEVTLDSRARIARGATPLDIDTETLRRALEVIRSRRRRADLGPLGPASDPHEPATVRHLRGLGL